ncbi:MAG: thioredoxin family protein [candidate division Zixibacteria bacterium]|nr:thioredoxin family protein [candidate division Zixibacteria bacterium]
MTNIQEMIKYKVIFTPGIVINERVVSSGKVPSMAEAQQLINKGLEEEIK